MKIVCFIMVFFAANLTMGQLPSDVRKSMLDSWIFKQFQDVSAPDTFLELAMNKLPVAVPEKPAFWSDIIRNKAYSKERRAFAVTMLLRRHIHPGMSLQDIARIFQGHDWVKRDNVVIPGFFSGRPVPSTWARSLVFYIKILPDSGAMCALVFEEKANVDEDTVVNVLCGKVKKTTASVLLIDLRVSVPGNSE